MVRKTSQTYPAPWCDGRVRIQLIWKHIPPFYRDSVWFNYKLALEYTCINESKWRQTNLVGEKWDSHWGTRIDWKGWATCRWRWDFKGDLSFSTSLIASWPILQMYQFSLEQVPRPHIFYSHQALHHVLHRIFIFL